MSKLVFDADGSRFFETGIRECVLFVKSGNTYSKGVAWNGITSISESPSGGEPEAVYADNIKYLNLVGNEEMEGSIEAYTYPDDFNACDGRATADTAKALILSQQKRSEFALVYKTVIGNDQDQNLGFKLHIMYNCLAKPTEKSYETINDSPEAITFSWDFTTTPIVLTSTDSAGKVYKPLAHLVIDSTKCTGTTLTKLNSLLDSLYGTDGTGSGTGTDPTLIMPDTIITNFTAAG